jgi:polyhydroxyalkanoate synthesis regulator phasin
MFSRTRLAALVVAIAAVAALPATADARSIKLRGVVSGSPYGASGGQMAIPVLFSRITSRDAGLRSPVGVIIVKRNARVKLPNGTGYALPVNLRTGDRFKGVGTIGTLQRRVFYPRVVFRKPVVYFRSKELSLGELTAAVNALQKALADLQNQLNALRNSSIAAFNALLAQLADLQRQLAALQALKVPDFQAQIDALSKKLDDLIAGLPDFSSFALLSDLPDLTGYAKLTDLTGFLTEPDVQTLIDDAIAGLNLDQYATDADLAAAQAQITALQGQVTGLTNDLASTQADLDATTSRLDTLCTALAPISGTLGAGFSTACP